MVKAPRLVLIEWEDSAQAAPQWQWLDHLETPGVCHCISVGFLVRDTKKEKSLAISIADTSKKGAMQAGGVITIPTRCVVRMRDITSSCRPYRAAASERSRKST